MHCNTLASVVSYAGGILQVVSKNLYSLLDTMLLFCNAMKTALVVDEVPQTTEQGQLDKGKRRRAGQVAMQLSQQFSNLTSQLIVSLGKCNLKIADGSEIMCLLESIQHSAFLGDDEWSICSSVTVVHTNC